MPFAYSLNKTKLNMIKNGPLYGKDNATCPDKNACSINMDGDWTGISKPDCMPWTALEVDWICDESLKAAIYMSVI